MPRVTLSPALHLNALQTLLTRDLVITQYQAIATAAAARLLLLLLLLLYGASAEEDTIELLCQNSKLGKKARILRH